MMIYLNNKKSFNKINKEWEKFICHGDIEKLNVRPDIKKSWKRSYNKGIPLDKSFASTTLNSEQLENTSVDLQEAAKPLLKEIGNLLTGTGQLLHLSNPDAVILKTVGDKSVIKNSNSVNFTPGSSLRESLQGTTSVGLAKKERRVITVQGPEHYCNEAKEWSCVAAPIINKNREILEGIVSLSGKQFDINKNTVGLIISMARSIESHLLERYLKKRNYMYDKYKESIIENNATGIVAVDVDNQIIDTTIIDHYIFKNEFNNIDFEKNVKQLIENYINKIDTTNDLTYNHNEFKIGSCTLICKPVFNKHIFCGVIICIYDRKSKKNKRVKDSKVSEDNKKCNIVGVSEVFTEVLNKARKVAKSDVSVIITGETGVGKEVVAKLIYKYSKRNDKSFIAVNCGAIPNDLIAGELFGYVPGAFTGASTKGQAGKIEAANKGTLFLDELGELSLEAQKYLLRVLEEGEVNRLGSNTAIPVDVRIIAATNKNIKELIKEGLFREDLYFRLNIVEINIPPLRKRREDIPHLINYFFRKCEIDNIDIKNEVMEMLIKYRWPGNIRELKNLVKRISVLGLDPNKSLLRYVSSNNLNNAKSEDVNRLNGKLNLEYNKKNNTIKKIIEAINNCDGNISKAASKLGIARSTIYRNLKSRGISIERKFSK